jgi:hypothetical protein
MNSIQYQIAELGQTLLAPDTGRIYAQASSKTWKLLQQLGVLALLLTLLFTATVVWVWSAGWRSGQSFRGWLERDQPPLERILAEGFKLLSLPLQKLATWANFQVKELLAEQDVEAIAAAPLTKLLASTPKTPSKTAN